MKVIKDLRNKLTIVRNQDARGTCIGFSTSDAHSFKLDSQLPMSVEYLYLLGKKLVPDCQESGFTVEEMKHVLEKFGQPFETGLPYQAKNPLIELPQGFNSEVFRRLSVQDKNSVNEIENVLLNDEPIVLALHITDDFFYIGSGDNKTIEVSEKESAGGHAVLLAGIGEQNAKKYFLVKNSWGDRWASQGYVWLSYKYVEKNYIGSLQLTEAA